VFVLWFDDWFAVGSEGRSRSRRSCPQSASAARSRRARLGRLAGGLGGALPPRAVDSQGGSLLLPCLPWAAAQHGSAAAAQGGEVAGRWFGSEGLGYISRSKKNFYDFFAMCRLSFVRRLLFSSAYRNPRRSLAGDSLAVRSCFSVSQLVAPSIPRIVRDRWRGVRGIAQGVSFRRRQRRLSRALCGTSGAEIGGSQGFSSRCRLLRDWKSLLDIMDIIYSVCLILLLSSSSISILIRSIL
jgi:hypothetical protein